MKSAAPRPTYRRGSFAEHDLDTEPYRTDEPGDDNCNHGLERIALRLLDTFAPASQVLKVGAQFLAILFLDPERGQDGRDGPKNHGVDIVVMKPLLFGQRLGDDGPDILITHGIHRLVIPEVIA